MKRVILSILYLCMYIFSRLIQSCTKPYTNLRFRVASSRPRGCRTNCFYSLILAHLIVGGKRHYISIPALLLLVLFYDQAFLKNFHLERNCFRQNRGLGRTNRNQEKYNAGSAASNVIIKGCT